MLVKPLVRPIVRAIAGNPTASLGSGFSPTSLFLDGSKGVVYDNNDLSSFYLDSAGTTAATVNGLVGLQLDKSAGLVLGAELAVNGGFDTNTSGWSLVSSPSTSVTAGVVNISSGGVSGGLSQDITVSSQAWAEIRIVARKVSGTSSPNLWVVPRGDFAGPNTQVNVTSGSFQEFVFRVKADATTIRVYLQVVAADAVLEVSNVTVKELPGNHRYQTTTGSKPVLRGTPTGANLVTNGDFASGTGWTAGSGWAIGSGVATATTSTGTLTHTLAATASKVYRLTYTLVTRTAGSIQPSFGGALGASRSAAGTYVEYLTTTTTAALQFASTALDGSIDNVEVVDVSAGQVTAPYGLQYDGVDDFMQTAAVDFTATDKMFVCAGVRKLSDATAFAALVGLSTTPGASNGAFEINVPAGSSRYASYLRGTATSGYETGSYSSPDLRLVSSVYDIAGAARFNEIELRLNGVRDTTISAGAVDAGTGNFGNYAIYFGRRGGTSLPYNGLDFGMVICGKTLTSTQITSTERYIAQRTGVTI